VFQAAFLMGWTAIDVPWSSVNTPTRGAVHYAYYHDGLDLAKRWFQIHGVDAAGEVVETKVKVIECVLVEAGNVSSRLPGIVFE
jgi:hypothetical protein